MVKKPARGSKVRSTAQRTTGYTKAPPARATSSPVAPVPGFNTIQSVKDQQRLLDVFRETFKPVLESPVFPVLLQEIKQALFNRDFAAAFGREDYLEAYAARWSPTRAICYTEVLLNIRRYLDAVFFAELKSQSTASPSESEVAVESEGQLDKSGALEASQSGDSAKSSTKAMRVLSIGGCAAEHVAFAAYLRHTDRHGSITLLDSAPWSHVIALLHSRITNPPELSKYASAAAKANNEPLASPIRLSQTFLQQDAVQLRRGDLAALIGTESVLVTLLFTLNELFTNCGIGPTTSLLHRLADVLPHNSLLLVVDSPGSYSEAALGKEKKRYPMHWLLNHTLLMEQTSEHKWERLESDESIWFRLPEGLSYPIPLENMRYQRHLYRLIKP